MQELNVFDFLASLLGGRSNGCQQAKKRSRRRLLLALDQLESRLAPAVNLLANGDLEGGIWSTDFGGGGSWATDQSHSPSHSLKIGGSAPFQIGWSNGRTTVASGATYTASMWVMANGLAGDATLNIFWY